LVSDDNSHLLSIIETGIFDEGRTPTTLYPWDGIGGKVWQSREPMIVDNYSSWPGRKNYDRINIIGPVMCVPLISGHTCLGVLGLAHEQSAKQIFDQESLNKLSVFARFATIAIENAKLYSNANKELTERKLVEEALLTSQEKFKAIFEQSPIGIELYDADGWLVTANKASLDIFGLPDLSDFQGYNIFDDPSLKEDLKEKLRKSEPVAYQLIYDFEKVKKNNQYKTNKSGRACLDHIITPISGADNGKAIGYLLQVQDITERKRSEREINMLAHSLRSINECVSITDTENLLIFVNQSFLNTYGYTEAEVIGKPVSMVGSANNSSGIVEEILQATLQGGWQGEMLNTKKDGTEFPIFLSTTIIKDIDDKPLGLIGVAQDITERKQIEEQIIFQRNNFEQLFINSPLAIAIMDQNDKINQINQSFTNLFGYTPEDAVGQDLNSLVVPQGYEEEGEWCSNTAHCGIPVSKESYRKRKDNSQFFVQIVGIPIIMDAKRIGIYAMYVDLTHRKKAEEEIFKAKEAAEQSDKIKTEFLAQISHEIRSPISIITNNTSLINDNLKEKIDHESQECFNSIYSASKRIIRTVDLILNMSELQAGSYRPIFTRLDLNSKILQQLYREFQLPAREKGIDLIYKSEMEKAEIIADEYSITQIFANLVDNALKYTKEGKVEILLKNNSISEIVVEVKDTGIGINKEFLPHIFKPFVQEENGYTRSYEGNGLGLSLVKKYCNINNANIELETKKNVGSTFRVVFGNNAMKVPCSYSKIIK